MSPATPQTQHLTIAAGEFKARCLKLMDEANEKQQPILVTKRGKPVGKFVPLAAEQKSFRSIFGRSPGLKLPNHTDWMKLKSEWAGEWNESNKKLLRNTQRPGASKR